MVDLEEVERVRKYAAQADGLSEANVCHFIVTPLLLAAGYCPVHISIQSHQKNSGTFPDYTILGDIDRDQENISFPWFIEVKAQGVQLTPQAATQACNYTHSKGRRWTVLTNGIEWYLYDVNLNNVEPSDKVILKMTIAQDEFTDLLDILSYQSVSNNLVEAKIKLQPLKSELRTSLKTASSGIIRSIKYGLQYAAGLSSFTEEDIVTVMDSLLINYSKVEEKQNITDTWNPTPSQDDYGQAVNIHVPNHRLKIKESSYSKIHQEDQRESLNIINNVTSSTPVFLEIGQDYKSEVHHWSELLEFFLNWICKHKERPTNLISYLPDKPRTIRGKDMRNHIKCMWESKDVYIETNNDTMTKIEMMKQLCMDVGLDQTDVNITFKYGSKK